MDANFKLTLIAELLLFAAIVGIVTVFVLRRMKPGSQVVPSNAARSAEFAGRFPVLQPLPEAERLRIIQQSTRSPVLWGSLFALLATWLWLAAEPLMGVSSSGVPSSQRYMTIIGLGILPAVLIIGVVVFVQGQIIIRLVGGLDATRVDAKDGKST
jgi:hypothetical protein